MDIDEIIDTYYQKIYKLCLFYLENKQEAEELVQEIFIKILKKQTSFKGESHIYTWIYRIAVNTLINYIKRKKLVEFISFENITNSRDISNGNENAAVDPALNLEKEELHQKEIKKLETCMNLLSNREKTAFYFFHYDHLKQKEIAEIMKTSISAVESLIHKAMKKLKRCVKDE
jgi:RNA polymerase sigma-70 factor (ECF subfamily)